MKSFLPLKMFGMALRFSGNNGNIKGALIRDELFFVVVAVVVVVVVVIMIPESGKASVRTTFIYK